MGALKENMNRKILYHFVSAIVLFYSCQRTEEVELHLSDPETKFILNALCTDSKAVKVYVSKMGSLFADTILWVDDAKLLLTVNQSYSEVLKQKRVGEYNSEYMPQMNDILNIEAVIPGYDFVLSATDTIPPNNQLQNTMIVKDAGIDQWGSTYSTFNFTLTNDDENIDYYELNLVEIFEDGGVNADIIYDWAINDPILSETGVLDYDAQTLMFSDELFIGKAYSFEIPFEPLSNGSRLDVKFYSISKTYYDYKTSWYKHSYNQGGRSLEFLIIDLGNPVQMFSNVKNGRGIFAAYNLMSLTISEED